MCGGVLSNRPWWYFGDLGRTSEMPCDEDPDSIRLWDGVQSPSLLAPWNWGATDHGGAPPEAHRKSFQPNDSGKKLTPDTGSWEVGPDVTSLWVRAGFSERWFYFAEFFCLWVTETKPKLA